MGRMWKSVGVVVGTKKAMTEEEADVAGTTIRDVLRNLLGVRDLATLRTEAVRIAMDRVRGSRQGSQPNQCLKPTGFAGGSTAGR